MPAKISKPTRKRIQEMYRGGARKTAIAAELGISRDTVARYTAAVDRELELGDAPAAVLTEDDVAALRVLAQMVRKGACATCQKDMWYLRWSRMLLCDRCGAELELNLDPLAHHR